MVLNLAELMVKGSKIVIIFDNTGPLVRKTASMLRQGLDLDPFGFNVIWLWLSPWHSCFGMFGLRIACSNGI